MHDKELYEQLLEIRSPWFVSKLELNVKEQRVNVWLEHKPEWPWACPECHKEMKAYDHAEQRAWRHLDSCSFATYVHARVPRVDCPDHGVRQVRVPWAEPHSRFTMLFERLAIDVLSQCDVSGAARILKLSWKETWHLMRRAVRRGRERKKKSMVRHIGVDEKAIAKGQKYMTLVCDLDKGHVEYIANDRSRESLDGYYLQLTTRQKNGIEAVAMDMWAPYFDATLAHVPNAARKIVFDRFHIMKHMGEAVDLVRRQENKELLREGDERLNGSRYLWLHNLENVPADQKREFNALRSQELKVSRAWALKETLRALWCYVYPAAGLKFWRRWHFWATHCRLEPIKEVAFMIKRHVANIVTYFRHRITNAVAEGLNSKIQTIKQMANGFRNSENFKTAIYFHCGGLDLYPR